jgi:hypothetical protein
MKKGVRYFQVSVYQFNPDFQFRYFDSNYRLQKVATVETGQISGFCWIIDEEFQFLHGFCNDLVSKDVLPVRPVITGNLQDPVNQWIFGTPVNNYKLVKSRFLDEVQFKEDKNG